MKNTQKIHLELPKSQLRHIDIFAVTMGESRSTIIRRAIHEFIENTIHGGNKV